MSMPNKRKAVLVLYECLQMMIAIHKNALQKIRSSNTNPLVIRLAKDKHSQLVHDQSPEGMPGSHHRN